MRQVRPFLNERIMHVRLNGRKMGAPQQRWEDLPFKVGRQSTDVKLAVHQKVWRDKEHAEESLLAE